MMRSLMASHEIPIAISSSNLIMIKAGNVASHLNHTLLAFAFFYLRPHKSYLCKCFRTRYQQIRVLPEDPPSATSDCNRTIWISSQLAFIFDVRTGSIAKFSFSSRFGGSCSVQTELFVSVMHFSKDSNLAFVTPLCAFNLFAGSAASPNSFFVTGISKLDTVPDVASYVRIAMLKSPLYGERSLTAEIEKHFSVPRLIAVGDVFAIDLQQMPWQNGIRFFFKVLSVEGSKEDTCYFVDPRRTTLYQVSTTCGPLPISAPSHILPPSFRDLCEQMQLLIVAYGSVNPGHPLVFLLSGPPGSGKNLLLSHLSAALYLNLISVSCLELWSEVPGTSEAKIEVLFQRAASYNGYCIISFAKTDVIGLDTVTGEADCRVVGSLERCLQKCNARAVFFCCDHSAVSSLSLSIRALVLYEFSLPDLGEEDRIDVLSRELPSPHDIDIGLAARHTCGFVLAELHTLMADASYHKYCSHSPVLSNDDVEWAIDLRNKTFADSIGAPKIPKVSWDDIGGLTDVKEVICESLEMIISGRKGFKRSGILLYGPPGCGKTLIAKAVASEFKVAFLSVKGPELLNKYVGQSESNVRKVFERARLASPCVVFFDELDSLAPKRGRSGDSGGVADRIVSQLLSELDSLGESKIFVLGATNRPDLLDTSLLTPGRFDKIVRVGCCADVETRERILRAASRKVLFSSDVDLHHVAEQCDERMSGADLYAVISHAAMDAIRNRVQRIEAGIATPDEPLFVTKSNLDTALKEVSPSLSLADLAHFSSLNDFA